MSSSTVNPIYMLNPDLHRFTGTPEGRYHLTTYLLRTLGQDQADLRPCPSRRLWDHHSTQVKSEHQSRRTSAAHRQSSLPNLLVCHLMHTWSRTQDLPHRWHILLTCKLLKICHHILTPCHTPEKGRLVSRKPARDLRHRVACRAKLSSYPNQLQGPPRHQQDNLYIHVIHQRMSLIDWSGMDPDPSFVPWKCYTVEDSLGDLR